MKLNLEDFKSDYQHIVIAYDDKEKRLEETRILINDFYPHLRFECIKWLNETKYAKE